MPSMFILFWIWSLKYAADGVLAFNTEAELGKVGTSSGLTSKMTHYSREDLLSLRYNVKGKSLLKSSGPHK